MVKAGQFTTTYKGDVAVKQPIIILAGIHLER